MKKRAGNRRKIIRELARAVSAFIICLVFLMIIFSLSGCSVVGRWVGTGVGNSIDYVDQKIDDATRYETKKKVEDTCRAMISSYEADKLTYEQYKDSENEEKQSWAEQAKMRANKTASTYNNYVLENSFVWSGNVPEEIAGKLEILK